VFVSLEIVGVDIVICVTGGGAGACFLLFNFGLVEALVLF
jgi:hypothetical protein